MDLTLFGYWRSSSTWRVRIALAYKGIPYTTVPLHLLREGGEQHTSAWQARNPMRQVPLLEVRQGEVVRSLTQSMAILEFLEEAFPSPSLLPTDPFLRGRARQLAEVVNSGIQPLQNLAVMQHLKGLGVDERAFCRLFIARGLSGLEAAVQDTAGRFSVGDQVSFADLFLVPQLYNARRFSLSLEDYPTLTRLEAECLKVSAFQLSHPDRQPDAEV